MGARQPSGMSGKFSPDAAAIEATSVALFRWGTLLGARYSVGLYTPAVRPASHEWAVLDLRGSPVVLAHDAFEAARWFTRLEAGACEEPAATVQERSDAEIEAAAFQERHSFALWMQAQPKDPGRRAATMARIRAAAETRRHARDHRQTRGVR